MAEHATIRRVLLPAGAWQDWSRINAALAISQYKPGAHAIRLPSIVHGGYHHVVVGVSYGRWGLRTRPHACAWRLVPLEMFEGPVYKAPHDTQAIERGQRTRGDMTGVLVRIGPGPGDPMVCDRALTVEMDLPEQPVAAEVAREWNAQCAQAGGWRTSMCRQDVPARWASLRGHPVVVYAGRDASAWRALIWRAGDGRLDTFLLDDDVQLDDFSLVDAVEQGTQLALL